MKKLRLLVIAVIIMMIGGIFYYYKTMKVSLIEEVHPKFSGYDTLGTVEYSLKDAYAKIDKTLEGKSDEEQKRQTEKLLIYFDEEDNLTNGQEITLIVSAPKDSKFVSETKKFKVSGLKATTKKTVADVVKDHPITVSGQNYFSELKYDTNILQLNNKDDSNNMDYGAYHNGDKLIFKLNDAYIQKLKESGVIINNANDAFEYTVNDLKDIPELMNNSGVPKINNLSQYTSETDDIALDESTRIETEYYKISGLFDSRTTITKNNVTKYGTFFKRKLEDKNRFEVATLYKINRTYKIPNCSELEGSRCGKTEEKSTEIYELYGNQYLEIKDGNIQNKPLRGAIQSTTSLNEMIDKLKSEKYMLVPNE